MGCALRAERNPGQLSNYQQHESEPNFKGIAFPAMPKELPKFEQQNDISTNVPSCRKKGTFHSRTNPHHGIETRQTCQSISYSKLPRGRREIG